MEAAGPNGSHSHHGLGHTRWATHGGVTERNAHPLTGCEPDRLAIVLNGIIENYIELREQLAERGHTLTSETDAEVVVHLLEEEYDGDLAQALGRVYPQLEGHFSIVAIHHDQPDLLVGVRHQTPLVVGLGDGENFLASSIAAFLSETRTVIHPRDGEVVELTPDGVRFFVDGAEVDAPERQEVDWDEESAEKGGYETFMLKEIFEQPEAVAETIGDRVRGHKLMLEALGHDRARGPQPAPDRDRRLRHRVPRRRRRPLHPRGVGAGPGRAGHRERVDLPQSGARRRTRS